MTRYVWFTTSDLAGHLEVKDDNLELVRRNLTLQKVTWHEHEILYFSNVHNSTNFEIHRP